MCTLFKCKSILEDFEMHGKCVKCFHDGMEPALNNNRGKEKRDAKWPS